MPSDDALTSPTLGNATGALENATAALTRATKALQDAGQQLTPVNVGGVTDNNLTTIGQPIETFDSIVVELQPDKTIANVDAASQHSIALSSSKAEYETGESIVLLGKAKNGTENLVFANIIVEVSSGNSVIYRIFVTSDDQGDFTSSFALREEGVVAISARVAGDEPQNAAFNSSFNRRPAN